MHVLKLNKKEVLNLPLTTLWENLGALFSMLAKRTHLVLFITNVIEISTILHEWYIKFSCIRNMQKKYYIWWIGVKIQAYFICFLAA